MPSQVSRAHGDRGAPPSFPHRCSWVLHSSLCALDVRGGPGTERPQTKTSEVTQSLTGQLDFFLLMSGISIRTILHWMYPCVLIHFLLRWLDWGFMVATWLYTMSSMSAPSSPSPTCGTGWVHSADLTGVDTFHCQSWGFNSLVRKSICMTLPQIHSKCPTWSKVGTGCTCYLQSTLLCELRNACHSHSPRYPKAMH